MKFLWWGCDHKWRVLMTAYAEPIRTDVEYASQAVMRQAIIAGQGSTRVLLTCDGCGNIQERVVVGKRVEREMVDLKT